MLPQVHPILTMIAAVKKRTTRLPFTGEGI
jgi:hypothetical protein